MTRFRISLQNAHPFFGLRNLNLDSFPIQTRGGRSCTNSSFFPKRAGKLILLTLYWKNTFRRKWKKNTELNAEKCSKLKLSQRWNFNVTCTCNFSSAIAADSAFSKLTNAQNLLGRIRTLSTWPHLLKSCSKCLSLTSSGLTLPTHRERHEPSLLLLSLNLKKSKQKLSYNLGRIKCP